MSWTGARRLDEALDEAVTKGRASRAEIARAINVDPSTLSHWASGRRSPDPDALVRLCRELKISADYLLGTADALSAEARAAGDEEAERLLAIHKMLDVVEREFTELKKRLGPGPSGQSS
jgi:transcriptional regulator with XRE-family HTH domain